MIQLTGDPLAAYTVDSTLTGEDVARLRHFYGLDQPVPIQYVRWLGNILSGNWGISFVSNVPVSQLIAQRLPNTHLPDRSRHRNLLRAALDPDPSHRPTLFTVHRELTGWLSGGGYSADGPVTSVVAEPGTRPAR